ncbi:hypothetical protein [Kitasatospora sp. NPDC093806]|uniref:hypothetical protein n=1 Tax=Kitasatospora sp. NPDC093806 TaxID=3155075 RepID=UPI00341CF4F8
MSIAIKSGVALEELGNFFEIAARRFDAGQAAPEMFSGAVDAAWHRLAEDPAAHDAFSVARTGRRLLHVEDPGEGVVSWVGAYEEAYGPLPEVWFTNADGTVNSSSLRGYWDSGEVRAEWNCSPVPGDGDLTPETIAP